MLFKGALIALIASTEAFSVPSAMRSSAAARSSSVSMQTGAFNQKKVKAIADKNVWVTFGQASECKPGTIISGFQYGQELAIVCEPSGKLYAMNNKMPPTAQPATFGELQGNGIITEPISQTSYNMNSGKVVGQWCPSPVGKIIRLLVGESGLSMVQVRKQGSSVQCLINVNAKAQFEANYWRGVLDSQGKVDGGYY